MSASSAANAPIITSCTPEFLEEKIVNKIQHISEFELYMVNYNNIYLKNGDKWILYVINADGWGLISKVKAQMSSDEHLEIYYLNTLTMPS